MREGTERGGVKKDSVPQKEKKKREGKRKLSWADTVTQSSEPAVAGSTANICTLIIQHKTHTHTSSLILYCSNRQMARETSRSWHFCHIVSSYHVLFVQSAEQKRPKWLWTKTLSCCVLFVKSSYQKVESSNSRCLFWHLFSARFSPRLPSSGNNISPTEWEEFGEFI